MALDNLTPDSHQQIIINMSAERTAVVTGIAGSGKSLTLLKKAKQVSTLTSSYAIIVYTKSLKQFFVDELAEIGQTRNHVFYYKEWQKSQKLNYKYMFIDECQDFNAEEITDFMAHGQYCWFFGDTYQSIMEFPDHSVQTVEATANQIGVHPQNLGINHRLTIENAKVGEHIYPSTRLSFACIKHGPKPRLIRTTSQLDKIIELVNNGLTDVGILVFYNKQVEKIRDYFQSRGIPVQWKTHDEMNIDFKSTSPKIINWHCAKGLQFNDVFIPCCGLGEYRQYVSYNIEPMIDKIPALYVAMTRSLENMYLLYTNNLAPALPTPSSPVYSGSTTTSNGPF
ncbi:MAG: DNA/RNA helicase [Bacteroidales bacterium]|nr:DNA/RNA helicase [Bacteroidales bacterium]